MRVPRKRSAAERIGGGTSNNGLPLSRREKPKYGGKLATPNILSSFLQSTLSLAGVFISVTLVVGFLAWLRQASRNSGSFVGPPSDFMLTSQRDHFTKVPDQYRGRFYVSKDSAFRRTVIRAFRNRGWIKMNTMEDAQIIYTKNRNTDFMREGGLEPWQRYNYFPGYEHWEEKEEFARLMKIYYTANPEKVVFIPETYRLVNEGEREALKERLLHGGKDRPWVLKEPNVNNGKGIAMLGPNSEEMKETIETMHLWNESIVAQAYICNELTWRQGQKFDLRFYWMVASLDPLIILYHDGYVRVGNSAYDEKNWTTTTQHLTTHTYLEGEQKGTIEEWEAWLRDFYRENRRTIPDTFTDPVQHVRNQLREIVAQTGDAFKEYTFGQRHRAFKLSSENGYGMFGFDTIIDKDLDVWYIEAQAGPGMEEEFDFRVELHRSLLRPMIDIVAEIQNKQEQDPKQSLLPIKSLQGWEIVYAGDWKYEYQGYKRVPLDEKKTCDTTSRSSRRR